MSTLVLAVKRCSGCGATKPASEFPKNRSAKDGLHHYCKPCQNEKVKDRQARRREEMGDDAYLAERRQAVRRHREKTAYKRDRLQKKAYANAAARLREAHPEEWEALYRIARYEVGL